MAIRLEEKQAQILALIADKPKFFADIMQQFDRAGQELLKKAGKLDATAAKANPQTQLTGLEIKGDTASGKQVVAVLGQTLEVPVQFKKVGGGWLLHVPEVGAAGLGNLAVLPAGAARFRSPPKRPRKMRHSPPSRSSARTSTMLPTGG